MSKAPEKLLGLLACPEDKAKLELDEKAEVLACPVCKRHYKIREGIPVMLLQEELDSK